MDINRLAIRLKAKEGFKLHLYRDTVGKLTVGYGRNIEDNGITKDEAELMLQNDIDRTVTELDRLLPWWTILDEERQQVIAEMAYNMGIYRLMGFTEMLKALQAGDYNKASEEMLNSLWAGQVKARALELAEVMKSA